MTAPKTATPSALADQIRARLDAHAHEDGFLRHSEATAALRAVLDLHRYEPTDEDIETAPAPYCQEDRAICPCPTVRAVAAALGVPVDDSTTNQTGDAR